MGSRATLLGCDACWLLHSWLALGLVLSVSGFSVFVCKVGVIMLPTP